MIGTYGKTMSEQKAENDGWFDCRGASNWLNPACWGPQGVSKRAAEDIEDATQAALSSKEEKKDKKGSGGGSGGGGLAPHRSGGIKAGGIAGMVMGVVGLALIAFILFGKKKRGRKT